MAWQVGLLESTVIGGELFIDLLENRQMMLDSIHFM